MDHDLQSRIDEARGLLEKGNPVSARFAIRKILRKEPDNIAGRIIQAEIFRRSGEQAQSVEAVNWILENVETGSLDSTLQLQLADTCFEIEHFVAAAALFEELRIKAEASPRSLYKLGVSLRHLGSMDLARQRLLECIHKRPRIAIAHLQLGHVHKALGEKSQAEDCYKKYISLSGDEKGTGYWFLADLKSYLFSDEEIALMQDELAARRDDLAQTSALHFALGWASEQRKNYSGALENYNSGNAIQARLSPFDTGEFRMLIDELGTVKGAGKPVQDTRPPFPILVVGLLRSGTTLIEQILSAHSRVHATAELPFLQHIALHLEGHGRYIKRLKALSEDEIARLRQQYLEGVDAYLQQQSEYFIDKNPGNFLHIGLVKRLVPGTIIIDARRDPRDVAISVYRQMFSGADFASSFDGIYNYYRGYLEIMDHWHSVYPGQIKTVNYERLVTSPDDQIAALLDFCGLEPEPGCFEFYKQKRAVTTPSVSGVTKPMYTSSIGQWRNYEEYARADMERLASLMEGR
jgi:tetratricopeptide (TPR) repeat protein